MGLVTEREQNGKRRACEKCERLVMLKDDEKADDQREVNDSTIEHTHTINILKCTFNYYS